MKKRKRKRVHLRWDKIVAMLAILIIVLSGMTVYKDFHKEDDNSKAVDSTALKKQQSKTEGKTVCIDAGHGGNDCGAQYKNLKEKDLTLSMALLVKEKLEKNTGRT